MDQQLNLIKCCEILIKENDVTLPQNATPVYTLTIPSTKKEFKYRPFLVKDEKALMIAQQSEDQTVMLDTIRDVIKSCAKSPIEVEKLASFDIEYIFIKLRAISVGEMVDLVFKCDVCEDPKAKSQVQINLHDVKVEEFPNHQSKIHLFNNVGIAMKYPSIDVMKYIETASSDNLNDLFNIVITCIDFIYDEDEIYLAKDQKREEIIQFLDNLTADQFDKIRNFFTTMPQLRVYVDYKCPVCEREHHKYLEGLTSFFS